MDEIFEIASIPIKGRKSIIEARNKILSLAHNLKFDPFTSNRLATFTSEFLRKSCKIDISNAINVLITRKNDRYYLTLVFKNFKDESIILKSQKFFDNIIISDNDHSSLITVYKKLVDPSIIQDDDFLNVEREKLKRKSKSALINDIKRKNKELSKILDEKEMLLKEIHHRVKNNLMVISSLLNIQSRYIKDKEARGIFRESQNRAKSMALIHERLYRSSDLKKIDFGDYIRTLARDLLSTYSNQDSMVTLEFDIDDIMLDINTTVPLGLIVNELFSNCFKHAFSDKKKGKIKTIFKKEEDNYILIVSDDGVGFPSDIDFRNTNSMGLQLVNSLADQINGEIELEGSNGTTFKITFQDITYDN
ncbi:MAG: sensor histidine kinase [Methanobacteriaceae archaeon]|nr:sensor histidine kinase [Methanobacteriaceae archaeon]